MSKGYYSSTPTLSTPTSSTPTLSTPTSFTPTLSTTPMPSAVCMRSATPCANYRRKMQQCNAMPQRWNDSPYSANAKMEFPSITFNQFACGQFLQFLNTQQGRETKHKRVCYNNDDTFSVDFQNYINANEALLRNNYHSLYTEEYNNFISHRGWYMQ